MIMRSLARGLVALAFLAVATPALAWKLAEEGQRFEHKASGYSIQFPSGWRYQKMAFADECLATRDGPWLQAVYVDFRKHKKAFPGLKSDAQRCLQFARSTPTVTCCGLMLRKPILASFAASPILAFA